jgi:SPP1 family predicted phage head-tail adaptor
VGAGKYNKRATIQRLVAGSPAQDAYGAPNETWQDFKAVWAGIEPLTGREYFAQQQIQNEVNIRVRIRYLSGVTEKMRVVYRGRIFDIESIIDEQEAHRELILMCSEGGRDG